MSKDKPRLQGYIAPIKLGELVDDQIRAWYAGARAASLRGLPDAQHPYPVDYMDGYDFVLNLAGKRIYQTRITRAHLKVAV